MASHSDFENEGNAAWQALTSREPRPSRCSAQIARLESAIEKLLGDTTDRSLEGVWIDWSGDGSGGREPRWIDAAEARRRAAGRY